MWAPAILGAFKAIYHGGDRKGLAAIYRFCYANFINLVGVGLVKKIPGDPYDSIRPHRNLRMIAPIVIIDLAHAHIGAPGLAPIGRFGKIDLAEIVECIIIASIAPDCVDGVILGHNVCPI